MRRQLLRVVDGAAIERSTEGQRQQDAKQQAVDVLVADAGQHPGIGQSLAPQRHLHPQLGLQLGPGLGDRLGLAGGAGAEQGDIQARGRKITKITVCDIQPLVGIGQRQPELRHDKRCARQFGVGEQAVKLALQFLQAGQPLMTRQNSLIAAEGAGEQRLREQQAVVEAERPARAWPAGAVVTGHGTGQLQAGAAQLGQSHLPLRVEGHRLGTIALPEGLQQAHGVSLLSRRRRTRYSAPIRPPIRR